MSFAHSSQFQANTSLALRWSIETGPLVVLHAKSMENKYPQRCLIKKGKVIADTWQSKARNGVIQYPVFSKYQRESREINASTNSSVLISYLEAYSGASTV